MSDALIAEFNAAKTWQDALATIKDTAYFEVLFEDLEVRAEYLQMLADLPDDQGREQAIGNGVNEVRKLFGDFDTVDEIRMAVQAQINVEHAKHVFIEAVKVARTPDELKAFLKDHLTFLNNQRQALIEDWSKTENNPAVTARVAELKADTYTIWLEQLTERLNVDFNDQFLNDLCTLFVVNRGSGDYFGVYSLLQNLNRAGDEASPVANPDGLLADGSQVYFTQADEAGEITFTAARQSLWTDPDVLKVGTGLPAAIKIAFDGPDFEGASTGRTTGVISEGGVVRTTNPTGNTADFFKMTAGDGKTPGADLKAGDQVSFVYVINADDTYTIYVDANGNGNLDATDVGFVVDADIVNTVGIKPIGDDHFVDRFVPTAPTVALKNDTGAAGDNITKDGTLAITGTETGATIEYSIDGGQNWTGTFAAVEGANTVQVRQKDVAGNVSPAATLTFVLDKTAPAAAEIVVAGAANGLNAAEATNAVAVTINPGADAVVVSATIGDRDLTVADEGYTFDAAELAEGEYTITVVTRDAAGNETTSTQQVIIDTTAPAAPMLAKAGQGFSVDAGAAVTVIVNGQAVADLMSKFTKETVNGKDVYTAKADAFTGAEDIDVSATVSDAAGNVSEAGVIENQSFDTTAPVKPGVALERDTGAKNNDKITYDATLMHTGIEGDTMLEFRVDGSQAWGAYDPSKLADGQHTVDVRARDTAGNVSQVSSITFTLDTWAPHITSAWAQSFAENANGTTGKVVVATLTASETATFTIVGGDDEELFKIVDGDLVYVGEALDFETATKHTFGIEVLATDEAGNAIAVQPITVNLTNVNEAPAAASTGNSASGNEDTVITGDLPLSSDVDAGDTAKYELVAPVAGLTVNANGTFSYTPPADFNGVVEFQYRVVDAAGAKSEAQTFKLTVNAVNDAPRDILLSNASVLENSKASTEIGKLTASDPEGGDISFTLLDDAGGRFTLDLKTGVLKVAHDFALDYEQATSHTIRVQVKDSAGAAYEETLTINIGDVSGEKVTGTSTSDVLTGNSGNDVFKAGAGNDTVSGGAGNDTLYGGTGNDKIRGGIGKDTLKGEAGKDTFVFDTTPGKSNVDKVLDFNVKDDSFWLDNAVFTKLGKKGTEANPAKLSKSFFTIGDKAKDKNDYVIYDDNKGKLFYDADGSGKGKQVEIATLSKNLPINANDFFVV